MDLVHIITRTNLIVTIGGEKSTPKTKLIMEKRGVGVVTDKERHEDEALKKCIQDAYGCSDEQLEKELVELEKSLSESDFPGIEDRLMFRLMARIAEEEEASADVPKEMEVDLKPDEDEESEPSPVLKAVESAKGEKKVVRVGKKKVLLVAALAAAFVGVLGVTAIGGKSYFFKGDEKEKGIVFDSGKNISDVSSLEAAYQEIAKDFGERILTLNYLPENTKFVDLNLEGNKATIKLEYNGNYLYFIQWKRDAESSINMESDREKSGFVDNKWLNQEIQYSENLLENGEIEFEAQIESQSIVSWIFGKSEREEFEKILEKIYFY